jgi:hypothetical protein
VFGNVLDLTESELIHFVVYLAHFCVIFKEEQSYDFDYIDSHNIVNRHERVEKKEIGSEFLSPESESIGRRQFIVSIFVYITIFSLQVKVKTSEYHGACDKETNLEKDYSG